MSVAPPHGTEPSTGTPDPAGAAGTPEEGSAADPGTDHTVDLRTGPPGPIGQASSEVPGTGGEAPQIGTGPPEPVVPADPVVPVVTAAAAIPVAPVQTAGADVPVDTPGTPVPPSTVVPVDTVAPAAAVAPAEDADPVPVPASGLSRRELRRQRAGERAQRRRQMVTGLVVAFSVVAAAGAGYVAYRGGESVLDLHGQNEVEYGDNAAEVQPTQVHLVVLRAPDDSLSALWLLALSHGSQGGGSILAVPPQLVVETAYGPRVLSESAQGGIDNIRATVEQVMGLAIPDVTDLTPERLAELVGPVAPLVIDNPDNIRAADGTVQYAAGSLELDAQNVAGYLSARDPAENDTNRIGRSELVWDAWLSAIGASTDPNVVPGEVSSGLGPVLREQARADVEFLTAPFDEVPIPTDGPGPAAALLRLDVAEVPAIVAQAVPFPASAFPGQRVRVRLLNGTGDPTAPTVMARVLVPLVAEITLLGDAESDAVTTTSIEYHAEGFAASAGAFAAALGLGLQATVSDQATDIVDVTIVMGRDILT